MKFYKHSTYFFEPFYNKCYINYLLYMEIGVCTAFNNSSSHYSLTQLIGAYSWLAAESSAVTSSLMLALFMRKRERLPLTRAGVEEFHNSCDFI